jgi:glycosyltransferase involved in cell wall biosynthesis
MSTLNYATPVMEKETCSAAPNWNSRRAKLADRMQHVKVCHLSPIQSARDERAFTRESLPAVPYGLQCVIVSPHSLAGKMEQVEFVAIPKSRNRISQILLSLRMLRWALKQNAEIYHVHSPQLIVTGLALKLLFGKKVVYDSREDFPSMMLTKTYLPRGWHKPISRLVAQMEKLAARFLDAVVTADSGSLRPMARTGKSRKLVLYNFPNLRFFPASKNTKKSYDLVYRGGLSERAGTFVLLRALRSLLDRGIPARLLLFGYTDDSKSQQKLRDALVSLGIENLVTLRGKIPHDAMASALSEGRIAVCPLQKIPKFMNNIPVKVFESWACGLPVIATDLPPIRPFFQRGKLGLLVKPGDPEDLANAITQLLISPDLIAEYGSCGRQAVLQRYNTSAEIHKLVNLYEGVLAC